MTFKPGDVVLLRSGGPSMTIVAVDEDEIKCVWIGEEGELFRESLPPVALDLVETDLEEDDEDGEDDDEHEDATSRSKRAMTTRTMSARSTRPKSARPGAPEKAESDRGTKAGRSFPLTRLASHNYFNRCSPTSPRSGEVGFRAQRGIRVRGQQGLIARASRRCA